MAAAPEGETKAPVSGTDSGRPSGAPEVTAVPEGTVPAKKADPGGQWVREWILAFLVGVALMASFLFVTGEVQCPACGGAGTLRARTERGGWEGTGSGVPCRPCDGSGKVRRIWWWLGGGD
ncbi:MAG: hypothetical protein HY720_30830 [Planctomycetes bacterium]|nr:hypothetical protein [Planctomycetota bacterium]